MCIKAGSYYFFVLAGKLERRAAESGVKYACITDAYLAKVHACNAVHSLNTCE
jgi:hypothetical protein